DILVAPDRLCLARDQPLEGDRRTEVEQDGDAGRRNGRVETVAPLRISAVGSRIGAIAERAPIPQHHRPALEDGLDRAAIVANDVARIRAVSRESSIRTTPSHPSRVWRVRTCWRWQAIRPSRGESESLRRAATL